MAIGDYVYRLKAQSGDSTPHDELASAGDLSGGTITLVDMGSGDYAWQFAGIASATGPSKSITATSAGSGVTMAMRVAVTTYDSSAYAYLMAWVDSTSITYGPVLGQDSANMLRARMRTSADPTISMGTINSSIRTIVIRAVTGANDYIQYWIDGATGSGDSPDGTSDSFTFGSDTIDTLVAGSEGSTIRVSDWVLWSEELSDADCHTLAEDGIRATLDVSGSSIPAISNFYSMLRSA